MSVIQKVVVILGEEDAGDTVYAMDAKLLTANQLSALPNSYPQDRIGFPGCSKRGYFKALLPEHMIEPGEREQRKPGNLGVYWEDIDETSNLASFTYRYRCMVCFAHWHDLGDRGTASIMHMLNAMNAAAVPQINTQNL